MPGSRPPAATRSPSPRARRQGGAAQPLPQRRQRRPDGVVYNSAGVVGGRGLRRRQLRQQRDRAARQHRQPRGPVDGRRHHPARQRRLWADRFRHRARGRSTSRSTTPAPQLNTIGFDDRGPRRRNDHRQRRRPQRHRLRGLGSAAEPARLFIERDTTTGNMVGIESTNASAEAVVSNSTIVDNTSDSSATPEAS